MVSGSPESGARTTRSTVRRVEISNWQQTRYRGNREKTPVGRSDSDAAAVVQRQDRTRETVGHLRLALREIRREEEELQPERRRRLPPNWKRFRAEEVKELVIVQNILVCGTDGKGKVKEELIRDVLRWEETTSQNGNMAIRAGTIKRASRSDDLFGTVKLDSWRCRLAPTGEDLSMTPSGRRHWTTTVFTGRLSVGVQQEASMSEFPWCTSTENRGRSRKPSRWEVFHPGPSSSDSKGSEMLATFSM